MQLTTRQEQILKTVVDSYVSTAHPVGSATIVSVSDLNVSSATVRNELAVLEEAGLVRQPHTSGGRVPTTAGYRYYVQNLMQSRPLPRSEARSIRDELERTGSAQEWLRLAALIMAHRLHNVGLVTAPRSTDARLRHLELISIQSALALLIVVLQDSTVLQEMLSLPGEESQDELSARARRLNDVMRGATAAHIDALAPRLPADDVAVALTVAHLLHQHSEQTEQVFHAGLADMISQPEFASSRLGAHSVPSERLRPMVEFLQEGEGVSQLFAGLPGTGIQIVIGGEAGAGGLDEYSFVLARYGAEMDSGGYLGVVGPRRMEYPRAVAMVRYMTDLMTNLMQAR